MATFGTVINCIDGPVQEPVARWMKGVYQLDFVDTVTERGPDKVLSESAIQMFAVRDKVSPRSTPIMRASWRSPAITATLGGPRVEAEWLIV